jgi:hypothetical protein
VKPATLFIDNTGAIYLIENQAVGARTKHIDVRMHHIREMINDKRMRTKFIRSENNAADVLTKNVTEKIHNTLVPKIKHGELTAIYDTATREDVSDIRMAKVRPTDGGEASGQGIVVAGREATKSTQRMANDAVLLMVGDNKIIYGTT